MEAMGKEMKDVPTKNKRVRRAQATTPSKSTATNGSTTTPSSSTPSTDSSAKKDASSATANKTPTAPTDVKSMCVHPQYNILTSTISSLWLQERDTANKKSASMCNGISSNTCCNSDVFAELHKSYSGFLSSGEQQTKLLVELMKDIIVDGYPLMAKWASDNWHTIEALYETGQMNQ
jgi:hypothetical protein